MQTLYQLRDAPYLTLTIQEEHDAAELFHLVQEEKAHLRKTLDWPDAVRRIEDTLATIQGNRARFFAGTAAVYLIRWQDAIAGVVSFNTIRGREGEIGYWIAKRFEGKGIARQSVTTLIDAYAAAGTLDTFIIKASVENPRSNALAQRLGFTLTERLENAEKIGGLYYDQNRYCLSSDNNYSARG